MFVNDINLITSPKIFTPGEHRRYAYYVNIRVAKADPKNSNTDFLYTWYQIRAQNFVSAIQHWIQHIKKVTDFWQWRDILFREHQTFQKNGLLHVYTLSIPDKNYYNDYTFFVFKGEKDMVEFVHSVISTKYPEGCIF